MQTKLNLTPVGRRRAGMVVLVLTALLLVPAAMAWACGPNRQMQLDRTTYAPGAQVRISGSNFWANTQVSFRLEPGGSVGSTQVSGTGDLSHTFTAPTAPGAYVVVAEGFDENGDYRAGLPARQSFEVARAEQQAPAGSPGTSPRPPASAQPAPTTPRRPGATRPGAKTVNPRRPSRSPSGRSRPGSRDKSAGNNQRPAARRRGGARSGAGTGTQGAIVRSGRPVFSGSVSRRERVGGVASPSAVGTDKRAAGGSGAPGAAPGPSERAASSDLWSGFSSGGTPSLIPNGDDLAADGETGSGFAWGVGLLGLGLLILLGGLAIAEARRRRALSRG